MCTWMRMREVTCFVLLPQERYRGGLVCAVCASSPLHLHQRTKYGVCGGWVHTLAKCLVGRHRREQI